MESTQNLAAPAARTRPDGLAGRLLADRHSPPLSIALHLVPGALIVAVYLLVTQPLMRAVGWPPFLGWAVAMGIALVPFELGLLLWLGHRRNGRFSLRGVVSYLDRPLPRRRLVLIVVPLVVWFLVVSMALTPFDNLVFQAFFEWLPYDGAGGGLADNLAGHSHSVMVVSLAACIPLTGLSYPLVEELYFRGFLMSRLPGQGAWTPVVSSALFSLYHLWSPWGVVSRVLYLLPGIVLVRRTRDLRVTMGMHAGTTFVLQTLGVVALLLNVLP